MRWNDVATLVSHDLTQDESGAWHEGDPKRVEVFCNRRSIGAYRKSSEADVGMRAEAEIEVMTCDYDGQTEVEFMGKSYDAEPTWHGDTTYLTLGRRISDVE